jgi:hypothetical protein
LKKKQQKTFTNLARVNRAKPKLDAKSFLVLFFKKEPLTSYP